MNTGGPAFPSVHWIGEGEVQGSQREVIHAGMTLRDWFAGMALQGMLARGPIPPDEPDLTADEYTDGAYAYADAMLTERKQP